MKMELSKEEKQRCRELAEMLIPELRKVAKTLGYALAVHGSLERDIDLIACPWTYNAVEPRVLAFAIQAKAAEINHGVAFMHPLETSKHFQNGCPGAKPFGRLCWTFQLGSGIYIDLSVMAKGKEWTYDEIRESGREN